MIARSPPLCLLALAILSPGARSQLQFTDPYLYDPGPQSVELGDANGDGHADLFVSTVGFGNVRIYLGHGDGRFEGRYLDVNSAAQDFAVADLDADGRDDLVTVDDVAGLRAWLAVGGGEYGTPLSVPISGIGRSVAAADLDGDGDLDLVAGLEDGHRASLALGDGDGGFTPVADALVPDSHADIRTGDVNGDDLVDLVSSGAGQVAVELGLGSASYAAPVIVFTGTLHDLDLGDLDRDGADDLAILSTAPCLVYGQVGGLPRSPLPQDFELPTSGGLRIADVDGDGQPDLAIVGGAFVGVNLQREDGTFGSSGALVLTGTSWLDSDLAFADIDHDGSLDMLSAAPGPRLVTVHTGQGDGGFRPAYGGAPDDPVGMLTMTAADFDLDGHLDLLADSSNHAVQPLRPGRFDAGFGPPTGISVGFDRPAGYAVCDADGDGWPDVLAYSFGFPKRVSITPGHGDLTFGTPTITSTGFNSASGAFADFDGDGRTDLVLVGLTVSNEPRLSRLMNAGTHFEFDFTLTFPPQGGQTGPVVVADLDEDGTLDVIVRFGAELRWLQGATDGGYSAPAPLGGAPSVGDYTLADLSGDGHLDVIGLASNGLLVASGNGDATFQSPTVVPTTMQPIALCVDDLDDDGLLDAAVATGGFFNPSTVNLYRGQGGGRLAPAWSLEVTGTVRKLVLADANHDGAKDLLVLLHNQILVLLNEDGPWNNLGHPLPGAQGYSELVGEGTLQPGAPVVVGIQHGAPAAPAIVVVGMSALDAPFQGGTLVPQPRLLIQAGTTDSLGVLMLRGAWPASVPSGASLFLQAWLVDAGGPAGCSATNALSGTTP